MKEIKSKNKAKQALKYAIIAVVLCIAAAAVIFNCVSHSLPDGIDDDMISELAVECESGKFLDQEYWTESHKLLGVRKSNSRCIVYTISFIQGFSKSYFKDAGDGMSGGIYPCALTFEKTGDGWKLKEFWTPGDGTDYAPSIRLKFPLILEDKALNHTQYSKELEAQNIEKAKDHFGMD